MSDSSTEMLALLADEVRIAYCREHGLHGGRPDCFVCAEPVIQVPMVHAAQLVNCKGALEGVTAERDRLREALDLIVRVHTEGTGPCDASCADEMLRVARTALNVALDAKENGDG